MVSDLPLPQDDERERGIKAIIFLQSLAHITETRDNAEKGWASMSDSDRENTMAAFQALGGGKQN